MDWNLAIRRNRDQLTDIVLGLFALARMRVGGPLFFLPRSAFSLILLVLRPAEAAVRRLIVIAAHGLAPLPIPHPRGAPAIADQTGVFGVMAFGLFDPLKSFDPHGFPDSANPSFESDCDLTDDAGFPADATLDSTPVDAARLGKRLNALMRALQNINAQARRLKRWEMKRHALLMARRPTRLSPMRPGLPPGWRQRKIHVIDDVLRECHGMANDLLHAPDSS